MIYSTTKRPHIPILTQRVEFQIDRFQPFPILVEVARHALQRVQHGFFGRHPAPHVFDDGVRPANSEVFLTAPVEPAPPTS